MSDSEKASTHSPQLKHYVWILTAVWTVIVATSLAWNVGQVRQTTLGLARTQARVAYQKDVIYRRWNAGFGGVYVSMTEDTPPNPYLTDVVERDIMTPSGKPLTLMNPAYMTRQVHELAEREYGVRGHITSLSPIRPENAPDPWEAEALQVFERGEAEISSVEYMEGKEYMRLMRPLITEKGCLKCHAKQGYREGDIRGGISVSIPMEPLWTVARVNTLSLWLGHGVLWLLGVVGASLGGQRLRRSEKERERAEETARSLAYHDYLTGLPNRRLFNDRLGMALVRAQRNQQKLAVMLLDLDHFKDVNDTLGHSMGDKLLQAVSERLRSLLRKGDTVARMGGDEFIVLLPEIDQVEAAMDVGNKILVAIRWPFTIDGHGIQVSTSVGIAIYPDDGEDEDTLLKNADIAMYQAKDQGRDKYRSYARDMNVRSLE